MLWSRNYSSSDHSYHDQSLKPYWTEEHDSYCTQMTFWSAPPRRRLPKWLLPQLALSAGAATAIHCRRSHCMRLWARTCRQSTFFWLTADSFPYNTENTEGDFEFRLTWLKLNENNVSDWILFIYQIPDRTSHHNHCSRWLCDANLNNWHGTY